MLTLARRTVEEKGKKPGRPRKDEGEKGTTNMRVFDEMAAQIQDLLLVLELTTAQIIQQVGGKDLNELYLAHKPQIDEVKAIRRAAEEAERAAAARAQGLVAAAARRSVRAEATERRPARGRRAPADALDGVGGRRGARGAARGPGRGEVTRCLRPSRPA